MDIQHVHHFDRIAFGYTGSSVAHPSLDGGYLLPAWSTFKAPPAPEEGKHPYFINDEWQLLPVTVEQVIANTVTERLPPEEKSQLIRIWSEQLKDAVAVAQGFKSMDDAVSYVTANGERGATALSLAAWRLKIAEEAEKLARLVAHPGVAMPTTEQALGIMPRYFPPKPQDPQ